MLAVDRVHRWRLLFSPRSCLSLRGVDVPETLFGFPRTIRLCFSTGTVSSLSESGGTGEASREETTYCVFFVVFFVFFFFFLVVVVLRHGSFQSHILFVDILYYCMVKRFGCYEKHQKKKKRKKKRRHHFCAPSSSFKRFFLCLFDKSIEEEEEDERRARTGTSKTLP